jgi:alpha-mannosidase
VPLQYELAVASNDDTKTEGGGFDGKGNAIPAEMLPKMVDYNGVEFNLASAKTGSPNAVVARGQTINLPAGGEHNRIYILAASSDGDRRAEFKLGGRAVELNIEDWGGFIGQWDTRLWKTPPQRDWAISANHAVWPPADEQEREQRPVSPRYPEDYVGLQAGYVKPASIAWYASHHHTSAGLNEPYQYSYLFGYSIGVSENERTLVLPNDDKIRILAISLAEEDPGVKSAQPLYDMLGRAQPPSPQK